ncbi:TM0106 family RecB-like putative nuclease [Salinisphaera orenii]|uniref:TM0106 family RecB-like putative nuclease n=1 Tax=Salinisphaera orenii TaxID=856731 RepID=UPI000DBE85A3
MHKFNDHLQLSASDLVNHLNCQHLTVLDIDVTEGTLAAPSHWDPLLDILRERGHRHETAFIEHLRDQGLDTVAIDGVDITPDAVAQTREAMLLGREVIVQAALEGGRWVGRADILRRVGTPSQLGEWSYEIIDTKLARETKGGTVLQLCLYANLLEQVQGQPPAYVYVVAPWTKFEAQAFRYTNYAAFYRRAKQAAENATQASGAPDVYPEPKEHCDVCRWQRHCDQRRRDDDHLCLVAGISKTQIRELQSNSINTVTELASMPLPMAWKPERGSPHSYENAREQARIQFASRDAGAIRYEMLAVGPDVGLGQLPEPSQGDVFFDIEGDPFVGEQGLEYLFGYHYRGEDGHCRYVGQWAFDREEEKAAFEQFIDFVTARLEDYPYLHVYHFAPYEPSTLKRLMGRYASREAEIDNFLRGKIFVDLYSVVRNAVRAGVESYSIKKLEPLYEYVREMDLHAANRALASLQAGLEFGQFNDISNGDKKVVERYNRDDCASTEALRDWLEARRDELANAGTDVPRPTPGTEASEELTEQQQRVRALVERLIDDVPADPEQRTTEQHARWILAHLLEWHRREQKASWWEYFRLRDLTTDELIDERAAIAHLEFVDTVDQTKTGIPIHRYRFEPQDTELRGSEQLKALGGEMVGTAVAVSADHRTIDIKKQSATADVHPEAVYAHEMFSIDQQAAALFRLGEYVAEHGIEGGGDYPAARALLLRNPPDTGDQPIRQADETSLGAALRIAGTMEQGVFPIQGPPGTGKSFTGARMICRLVEQGRKVGITANSHKVVRNLLDKVVEATEERGTALRCIQKPKELEPDQERLIFTKKNNAVFDALESGQCQVAGGTHFLWSREEACDTLDVLVVDEAAQMSLANTVAVAQSARLLILLGDPQQLDQPTQGTHPDGTGVSSLEHILGGEHTIPPDRGLFLEQSWRLHPAICGFHSELFYDDKLTAQKGCARQTVQADGSVSGSGLYYLPVQHHGNQNASAEEAKAVAALVNEILGGNPGWTNRDGQTKPLGLDDIVIITPYNAQVFEIQQRLPGARVGTVDKFQGQEAPIAIYSVVTSSHANAPRGMEFLYSSNRLNVGISRAQCLAILVSSPQVFEADCKTPRQMQLANAFCRYLEYAKEIGNG